MKHARILIRATFDDEYNEMECIMDLTKGPSFYIADMEDVILIYYVNGYLESPFSENS